jgi:Fe(II)/alpha-ketoglutarate-dependent arginine beta-hydroxylase
MLPGPLSSPPISATPVAHCPGIVLEPSERSIIRGLVDDLAGLPAIDGCLLDELAVRAHAIPQRIHRFFRERITGVGPGYWVMREALTEHLTDRPTPGQHALQESLTQPELALIMLSTLLGEIFGWATQQDGQLVHDIVPIRGKEQDPTSACSQRALTWHTEDAFHPFRADYLGLMCLRNSSATPTTVASFDDIRLTPEDLATLMQPRYLILPDPSHTISAPWTTDDTAHDLPSVTSGGPMDHSYPAPTSVLFGDPRRPFIRCDPDFTTVADRFDVEAARALEGLVSSLDNALTDVVLAPGDLLFIDNYRAIHGRRQFQPSYDGQGRWLKRVNITRDLRKMAVLGVAYDQRIVPSTSPHSSSGETIGSPR